MSVGVEVISRPLCKWNIYDVADFLYENGKNMNSDNWQRIADDMAMVAGDVRRMFGEALQSEQDEFLKNQLRNSEMRNKRLEAMVLKIDEIINGTE